MTDTPQSLVALRQRREQTIARLCEHFALDHLEAEELEQLIDRAHQATSLAELDGLLAGLPSLDQPAATPAVEPALRAPVARGEHQAIVAIMGGATRKGPWAPARKLYVTAVMGGAQLDFRDARLAPGVTEVFVVAIMGGVEIIVPPGVRVESNGLGIMGGFDHRGAGSEATDESAPVLRVSGLALMGGVEIRERARARLEPGDEDGHSGQRRRRLRDQRRELKEEMRRLRREAGEE